MVYKCTIDVYLLKRLEKVLHLNVTISDCFVDVIDHEMYQMRLFGRRRYIRRPRRARRRSIKIRRRLLVRRRVRRFVNKMGFPSYVKMIGMTEGKRLMLRRTLSLQAPYSKATIGTDPKATDPSVNVFQVVLNPLECPNINKAFTTVQVHYKDGTGSTATDKYVPMTCFRYDYIRIRSIFISIKPTQNVSTSNTKNYSEESGLSNAYAYFSYKYPMLIGTDIEGVVRSMYDTNPDPERIIQEGRFKNVYTWPSNKAMTISLNKLYYRVSSLPFKLCPNGPLDIQFLSAVSSNTGIYDPFKYNSMKPNLQNSQREKENDGSEDEDSIDNMEVKINNLNDIEFPDLDMHNYDLFFGRLVIVCPKEIRFTAEICYDCMLFR